MGGSAAPESERASGFVALDRLRGAVEGVDWARVRLGREGRGGEGARTGAFRASPRLPHALVLHLAHAGRGDGRPNGRGDETTLGGLLGADPAVVRDTLGALAGAGVVRGDGGTYAVDPALFGPAPACAGLDWGFIALATAGAPSAWVGAHVLAERLAPDAWVPLPRAVLEDALGCQLSGLRAALDRLVAAEVLERRPQRGGVSAYRFAARAWGGAGEGAAAGPVAPPTPVRATPARETREARVQPTLVAPPAAAAPVPTPAGVQLVVNGVQLDLAAGVSARVDVGPDGRPQITIGVARGG